MVFVASVLKAIGDRRDVETLEGGSEPFWGESCEKNKIIKHLYSAKGSILCIGNESSYLNTSSFTSVDSMAQVTGSSPVCEKLIWFEGSLFIKINVSVFSVVSIQVET